MHALKKRSRQARNKPHQGKCFDSGPVDELMDVEMDCIMMPLEVVRNKLMTLNSTQTSHVLSAFLSHLMRLAQMGEGQWNCCKLCQAERWMDVKTRILKMRPDA